MVLDGASPEDERLCRNHLDAGWKLIVLGENLGKGASLRQGFAQMEADYYLFTDDDFPYTLESMDRMVDGVLRHKGVVFGRRTASYRKQLPFRRRLLSESLRLFNRYVLGLRHPDTQCGLKAFDQEGRALVLMTKSTGFSFDLELALLCQKQGITWSAVDIHERDGLRFSDMPLSLLQREWQSVRKFLFR